MNENTITTADATEEIKLVKKEIQELQVVEEHLGYVQLMRISCVVCGANPTLSCVIPANNLRLYFCSFNCLFEWDKRFPDYRNTVALHKSNNRTGGDQP